MDEGSTGAMQINVPPSPLPPCKYFLIGFDFNNQKYLNEEREDYYQQKQ
jgi:hypothetical protein